MINKLFITLVITSLTGLTLDSTLTPADIKGPDGLIYPNWSTAGLESPPPKLDTQLPIAEFGGIPNDDKDDADALEKGMDTLGKQGGGILLLSEGTYRLERPVVCTHDKVVIQGEGIGKTKIDFDYLPKNNVAFFRPQKGEPVTDSTWIEIHAKPQGLSALRIKADGRVIAEREKHKHWGGTFSINTRGSAVRRVKSQGKCVLTAVAEYDNGKKFETTLPVNVQSSSRDAPTIPRYLGAITFVGQNPTGPKFRLAKDAERGSYKIQLERTGDLKPGDVIILEAPKTERWDKLVKNACQWGTYRRNEYRIKAINIKTITLAEPLRIPYPTIDGSYIQRYQPVEYGGVRELTLEQKQELWTGGIIFSYAWNCWVDQVEVLKAGRWPVYTTPAKHCEVKNSHFVDAWYHGGGGTAYVGFEMAYDCLMENVTTDKMRHAPCLQWSAAGNVIRNSTFIQSDGQWHAGWTRENLFENCTIDAKRGTGSYGHGMWASPPEDTAHGPNGPRNVVWGCDVKAPRNGVWMGGMNHGWLILYNRFVCDDGYGVFMKTNSDDHQIRDNVFILNSSKPAFFIQSDDCDGIEIVNNKIIGGSKNSVQGRGIPKTSEGNHHSPKSKTLPPKPEKPVKSIFEWQKQER